MTNFEPTKIFEDPNYEVYSFTVQTDGTILFNGLRLSDGNSIVASVGSNGTLKILDETLNTSSSILQRLY